MLEKLYNDKAHGITCEGTGGKCGELPCTISNVAQILGKSVNAISPTRAQLISKGMIFSTGHGEIDFTVPQFDLFLKRMNPDLRIEK